MTRSNLGPLKDFLSYYGYHGNCGLPEIAGKYEGKKIFVVGDDAQVWDDLRRAGAACYNRRGSVYKDGWDILTINKIIETIPAIVHHAYSNEYRLLEKFIQARRFEYRKEFTTAQLITHGMNKSDADYNWPFGGHGTSGLGGTLVAIGLGYSEIVLCGMGLTDGPHNGEPPWRGCAFTKEASSQKDGKANMPWYQAIQKAFHGKVKSMSGRTREWLGQPEWVSEV